MVNVDIEVKDVVYLSSEMDKEKYKKTLSLFTKEDFINYLLMEFDKAKEEEEITDVPKLDDGEADDY